MIPERKDQVLLDLHSSAVESFSMPKQLCVAWEDKTSGRKDNKQKTCLLALQVISLLRDCPTNYIAENLNLEKSEHLMNFKK